MFFFSTFHYKCWAPLTFDNQKGWCEVFSVKWKQKSRKQTLQVRIQEKFPDIQQIPLKKREFGLVIMEWMVDIVGFHYGSHHYFHYLGFRLMLTVFSVNMTANTITESLLNRSSFSLHPTSRPPIGQWTEMNWTELTVTGFYFWAEIISMTLGDVEPVKDLCLITNLRVNSHCQRLWRRPCLCGTGRFSYGESPRTPPLEGTSLHRWNVSVERP